MSDTVVEDHYFEYSSMKYFRDAAENIQLCSYGAKHAQAFGPGAYLEVQNLVKRVRQEGRDVGGGPGSTPGRRDGWRTRMWVCSWPMRRATGRVP